MIRTIAGGIHSFWTGSIKRQLIIGIALVHAVLMSIFIVDLVERQRAFMHKQSLMEISSLGKTLAANSVSWVLANDVIGLEEVVHSLATFPGLQYAMVLSPTGLVLSHTDDAQTGKYIADDVSRKLIQAPSEEQTLINQGSFTDVAQPILANGRFIGWARVAMDRAESAHSLSLVTRDGAAYIVLAIIVGTVFAYLMGRGLTVDLHRIVTVANGLKDGRHNLRVETKRTDELGILAHRFNAMADEVQDRERELIAAQGTTARLGRILDDSWNEIYIFDGESYRFIQVNRGALTNMGYSMEEMENLTAYDIKPDFTREAFVDAVQLLRDGTEQYLVFEARHQRKDGTIYPVEVRLQFLPNEEPPIFVAVINDTTKRKAAQQEIIELNESLERRVEERTADLQKEAARRQRVQERLRASEAKTRQIVNSAVDGIITTDEKGVITSFNTAAEKIFGYSVIEAIGQNVTLLMPAHQAARHGGHMARYTAGGEARVMGMGRELVARRKDGATFLADFSISDFHHGDTMTFVGIIRDITERKEAEYKLQATLEQLQNTQAELVQAEKMASLGGLVAGVAHEINTPISVGVTAATHLKEQADHLAGLFESGQLKKSDFQAFIGTATQSTGMISANLNRASDLIKSFKQVAVDQSSEEKRTINLLDYVDEVLVSLDPQLKRTAHRVAVEGDRDIHIETYPGALAQVVTNLLMNSVIHAYDDGEAGHIKIEAKKNGESISLLYSDDGKGMDESVSAKIFEPFFTTKRGSGGSGLGMHILYNQVTQTLGGSIDLHSTPGRGTAFDISIPQNTQDLQAGEAR